MEEQKTSSRSRGTGLDGPKPQQFVMMLVMVMIVKYLLFKFSMGNSLICIHCSQLYDSLMNCKLLSNFVFSNVECPFSVSFVAARFEVLTAVVLKFQAVLIGTRCQLVNNYQCFEGNIAVIFRFKQPKKIGIVLHIFPSVSKG
jgi:hypothetical protein